MKTRRIFVFAIVALAFGMLFAGCAQEHEHSWVPATCTTPKTCETCQETEGEPLGHVEEELPGKSASCSEEGLTAGKKCSVCDEIIVAQEPIKKLPHTEVTTTGTAATCTEAGLTDGKYCDVCDEVLVEQETIPAAGHKDEDGNYKCDVCTTNICEEHTAAEAVKENEKAATCTETGSYYSVVKCSKCGEELSREQKTIDALGHTEEVVPGKAATCTATGLTDGKKCSVCDEILVEQEEIPTAAHTEEVVPGKAATCTENGLTDGKKCSVCGETLLEQEEIPAAGHKDENGDYECDVCKTDLCTDHNPGEAVKENEKAATCTEAGSYDSVVKCSKCGEEISRETITVGALGHTEEVIEGKAATCTATGLTDGKKCTVCGETTLTQEEIPVLEHVMDDGVVDGTKKTYTCENGCGKTEVKYLVTVNYLNLDGTVAAGADIYEYEDGEIYTINAKAIEGYVASHDYIKGHILSAGNTVNIYYSQVDVWDGTSVSEGLSGTGIEEDPFLIQSAADFAYFANKLNNAAVGTTENFKGQYVKMTKSIDLGGNLLIAGNHSGWDKYQGFGGTFDGNNCTIRGINVQPTTGTSSALFGCITKAGTLKNLLVYGNAKGAATVGGVVAYQLGKVDNVTSYVTVTATGGTIGGVVANQESSAGAMTNCVNYGSVTSESYIVGGVAGSGGATMTNCVNWGNVQGGSEILGGIAGTTKNKGTISGCVNYGSVTTTAADKGMIGGIAGKCLKPVSDCVNYGTINGVNTTGGIVGSTDSTITDCVNYGAVNATSWLIGGIAGSADANVTNCVNHGAITSTADCVGGIVGSSKATVSDCDNYGTITGTGRSAGIAYYSSGTIDNCVNYGNVIGGWDLGGILAWVGDGQSATITNCTNNGNITGSWNNGGIFGLAHDNAGVVTITGCTNNGHIKSTTGGQITIAVKAVITDCTENGSWTAAE